MTIHEPAPTADEVLHAARHLGWPAVVVRVGMLRDAGVDKPRDEAGWRRALDFAGPDARRALMVALLADNLEER